MRPTPLSLSLGATVLPVLLLLRRVDVVAADCSIPLRQLSEPPPLLLRPGGPLNVLGFAAPDADHVLRLKTNALLELACPGPHNHIIFPGTGTPADLRQHTTRAPARATAARRPASQRVAPRGRRRPREAHAGQRLAPSRLHSSGSHTNSANRIIGLRQVNVTCTRGSNVTVRGTEVDLRAVKCAKQVERTAEKEFGRRCGASSRGQRMRIGFRILTGFLELVTACFDDQFLTPIYSNYTLVQSIAGSQTGGGQACFRTSDMFGRVSPQKQYEQWNQTLQTLLGPSSTPVTNDSIIRGHLTPRAGFIYTPQKRVTYFYVNVAPQWRSINSRSWLAVERAVRNLAVAHGDLLEVTGVYGVTSLRNVRGVPTPLYLFADNAQHKMPVPALFWKVVWDERTRKGAAVVANNNPWEPLAAHPELRLCENVCARLRWLPTPPSDIYCCEVNELRRRIPDLPPLRVEGLLEASAPSPSNKRRLSSLGGGAVAQRGGDVARRRVA